MIKYSGFMTCVGGSPFRLDAVNDFYTDGQMLLVIAGSNPRPADPMPAKLLLSEPMADLLFGKRPTSTIDYDALLLRVGRFAQRVSLSSRAVNAGGFVFDAWKIWAGLMSVICYSGTVEWSVSRNSSGHALYLHGEGWAFVLMGIRDAVAVCSLLP